MPSRSVMICWSFVDASTFVYLLRDPRATPRGLAAGLPLLLFTNGVHNTDNLTDRTREHAHDALHGRPESADELAQQHFPRRKLRQGLDSIRPVHMAGDISRLEGRLLELLREFREHLR